MCVLHDQFFPVLLKGIASIICCQFFSNFTESDKNSRSKEEFESVNKIKILFSNFRAGSNFKKINIDVLSGIAAPVFIWGAIEIFESCRPPWLGDREYILGILTLSEAFNGYFQQ